MWGLRALAFAAALACASIGAQRVASQQLSARERAAWQFVERRMLGPHGAMATMVPLAGHRSPWATHKMRGVLAESSGLLMSYAVLADRPERFAEQLAIVDAHLVGPYGLVGWRASPRLHRVMPSSASIDDLTIARALLDAGAAWDDPALTDRGVTLGRAVLRYQVDQGQLVDAASWDDDGLYRSSRVQLAYLDLQTMRQLEEASPGWTAVRTWAVELLRAHRRPDGLYPDHVEIDTGEAGLAGDAIHGIHTLYCALHLAEAGEGGADTLAWFVGELERDGRLAGRYRPSDGAPIDGFEGVAVYALAARLALALGENEAAERFVERMLDYQRTEGRRGDRGAFSCADTAHSFDNLQALIALRSLRRAR